MSIDEGMRESLEALAPGVEIWLQIDFDRLDDDHRALLARLLGRGVVIHAWATGRITSLRSPEDLAAASPRDA